MKYGYILLWKQWLNNDKKLFWTKYIHIYLVQDYYLPLNCFIILKKTDLNILNRTFIMRKKRYALPDF